MSQQLSRIAGWRTRLCSARAAAPTGWIAQREQRPPRRSGYACASTAAPSSSSSDGSSASSLDAGGVDSGGDKLSRGGSGPINKQVVATQMSDALYTYLLQHTREPQVLRELREETAGMQGANMQVSPEQGAFMGLLAELTGATRCVEVGVYTGYSSLAVALALPPDGRLVACDRDERSMEVAKRYWRAAGVDHKIDARLAPAEETLTALLRDHGPGSFDFAFIDADKRAYGRYYELCLQLVRRGGLVAVDNVLWYGKVAEPQLDTSTRGAKATQALIDFNAALVRDERITLSIVPIGDGMALCRKR